MKEGSITYKQVKSGHRSRKLKALLLASGFSFYMSGLMGQNQIYPVSVSTQLIPPYSVNLADYAAPGCEQLKVIIMQRDLTQAPYLVYLKMEIELNGRVIIRSSPDYFPPAITLEPGIPQVISGTTLSEYFDPQNMDFTGYSRESYIRTKLLPEGAYVITFTAYDMARRNIALSHGGSSFCYLAKTNPPTLNLPLNNAMVSSAVSQNINFNWIPGNTSSPNSAFSTRYQFELFEMRAGGIPPAEVVRNSLPVYVEETDRTSLLYSIDKPHLEEGIRYVWRIRAVDTRGRDYIRNNGFSEVFSFVYGKDDEAIMDFNEVENFIAKAVSARKALLSWDNDPVYDRYKIYYRKQGKNNKWYESETNQDRAEISGLNPGIIYECRVQGRRKNIWGEFSKIDTVWLPMIPVIECGSPFQPLETSNRVPLPDLMKMQEFDAGGFMVTVLDSISRGSGPGRFSGNGFVQVPLFAHKKISCRFDNILINTDFRMLEGSVRLITNMKDNAILDMDEVFEGGDDNGEVVEGIDEAAITLQETVIEKADEIHLDTLRNKIQITSSSGEMTAVDITEKMEQKPKTITLKDSEGNLYSIDTKTGKATSIGKAPSTPGRNKPTLPSIIDNSIGIVNFDSVPGKTMFAYDKWNPDYYNNSNLFKSAYQTMKMADGSLYDVPFKLVPFGQTDVVLATFDMKQEKYADSINFVSGTGTKYYATPSGKGKYLLSLPSGKANDGIDVFATCKTDKGKTVVLGQIRVLTYNVSRPKLILVPVNDNGKDVDPVTIKNELDKIYSSVAIDWQVSIDTVFSVTIKNLNVTGSGLFSQYSEEMKQINNEFIKHKGKALDQSALYLFLLQYSDKEAMTGDMPRSKQFGYIFTKTAQIGGDKAVYRTIAHEVAHGAFHLKHTFDSQYQLAQGTTNNLLDYTAGGDLIKPQWDAIHDPGLVIGMFEKDEDGAMSIFGITWLGNYLWGLAPDKQESEIEATRSLFSHVYENYNKYFSDSKSTDISLNNESYKNWSVRKESHQGIAKKVFKGLKESKTTFSLFKEGIYFEDYTLEKKVYKIAVYSKIEDINLNQDIRIKSFKALRYNSSIKVGFTDNYGLIVFYDGNGKVQMVLQIIGGNTPKEAVTQWVNYLGLLLPSEDQKEEDKENSTKELLKTVNLNDNEKLNEIWGEGDVMKYEEVMLNNVQWVSQFDETVFGLCSGCWTSTCCRRAAEYMMGNTRIANCTDSIIAKNAPNMTVNSIITTAIFHDNTSKYTKDTYNSATLKFNSSSLDNVIQYVNERLNTGRPVLIGMHYNNGNSTPPNNSNKATRHFMVIVGMGMDGENAYFRFFDPGRTKENEINATSPNNKLIINRQKGCIQGNYNNRTYTLTEILQTN